MPKINTPNPTWVSALEEEEVDQEVVITQLRADIDNQNNNITMYETMTTNARTQIQLLQGKLDRISNRKGIFDQIITFFQS